MIKHLPRDVWAEYQRGVDYNTAIDLYETVRVNRNFFLGKQWEGLHAPDLPKPVMNIMKRVISYQTSMITSDDVGVIVYYTGGLIEYKGFSTSPGSLMPPISYTA